MGRLYGLDALRGMAALVVLFMHVFGFAAGHLAVDFFFMLSGFVIARTYETRLKGRSIGAGRFLIGRYRRLWPTMAAGASMGLAFYLAAGGSPAGGLGAYICALVLIPGSATLPYLLNLPAWSIFYELLANGLHGLVFARLRSRILAGLLVALAGLLLAAFHSVGYPRILTVTSFEMQLWVIPRALFSYVAGILLFRLIGDRQVVAIPLGIGLVALPAYAVLVAVQPFDYWPLPFIFIIAPLMIMSGLSRTAAPGMLIWLGDISFPLYALHLPVIQAAALLGGGPVLALSLSLLLAALWVLAGRSVTPFARPLTLTG